MENMMIMNLCISDSIYIIFSKMLDSIVNDISIILNLGADILGDCLILGSIIKISSKLYSEQ